MLNFTQMKTNYSLQKREPIDVLLQEKASIEAIDNIKGLLSSLSYIVFILNKHRQIVFANNVLLKKLNIPEDMVVLGKRPGEALDCQNAFKAPGGCGNSPNCKYCGALSVILDVQETNLPSTKEARIVIHRGDVQEQLDLEISGSFLNHENNDYVIISALDVTDKKRKELLERTFFHDIINLAGSLDGIMEMMDDMTCEDRLRFLKSAKRISNSLVEEILSQQELTKAENNELSTHPEAYEINELIKDSVSKISYHEVAKNKHVEFVAPADDYGIITDKVILNRVLTNMLKNALEASKPDDKVSITAKEEGDGYVFSVHNNSVMSDEVQTQIFQRSFSTKGTGRGIGTYSMKLLGERYLKGEIGFTSTKGKGTTFFLKLPLKI